MKWWLTCIRKYVTFEGRARRKEYWMFTLFNVVFVVVTMLLDILLFGATPRQSDVAALSDDALRALRFSADIDSGGTPSARYRSQRLVAGRLLRRGVRLYDPDDDRQRADAGRKGQRNGVDGVGFAVLMITAVWMIVWMCFDSQAGENKYGPNPKQIAAPVESAAPAAAAEPSEPETPESGVTGFRRQICVVPARNDAPFLLLRR